MKSTPIDVIHAEAGELPIKLRWEMLSDRYMCKIMSTNSETYSAICELNRRELTYRYWKYKESPPMATSFREVALFKQLVYNSDMLPLFNGDFHEIINMSPVVWFLEDFSILPSSIRNAVFQEEIRTNFPNSYPIYTDGSKVEDQVGCAYFDPFRNTGALFKLPNQCSVFTAELVAILEALKYAHSMLYSEVIIVSDCKSALYKLKAIKMHKKYNHIIINILKKLLELKNDNKIVRLVWSRAHCGIEGNERVDILAKQAAVNGTLLSVSLPYSDFKACIRKKINEKWQRIYSESPKGKFYKSLVPKVGRKPWFSDGACSKQYVTIINRLRSDHCVCKKYLHRIGKEASPLCTICDSLEDMEHIVMACSKYTNQRDLFFKNLKNLLPGDITYPEILKNRKAYEELVHFINVIEASLDKD
ncbi:uncharacterized protein [Rhodnius prolixus]